MRVSHQWLQELVPGLVAAPSEVAERLTRAGLEVEGVEQIGEASEHVLVAAVTEVVAHPSRERLQLVTVDRGAGETQRVVCGANNVPEPGGLVVLAPLGTTLPAVGITLEPREIGGVVSEGMLCSEKELGLADDSDGILVLPAGSGTPGQRLVEALPQSRDVIFEIGVTPNRPDALGHLGVARDVAALFGLDVAPPVPGEPARVAGGDVSERVTIENRDPERCPHYGAAVVTDVRVGPSPARLRWRLHSLGVRPISNVVDVTNLILLELGQPMHAFDMARVAGDRIIVRRAEAGERITTLDGAEHELTDDDLVICDAERPSALAGIMGGADSEIRAETTTVLLECAYFEPRGVRRTGRRHGIHSDSSFRFERGTDRGGVERALERAAVLLSELADAAVVPGRVHARGPEPEPRRIRLRGDRLDALLGHHVPFDEALDVLERLGIRVLERSPDTATAEAPSWRPDLALEADLIEEVARLRGLDEVPSQLPPILPQAPGTAGQLERRAAEDATALGLSEALTFSFVSRRELEVLGAPAPVVELKNPLSEERSVMRTSLLPGLLEAVGRARRRGEHTVRLFAVGSVFLPPGSVPLSDAARRARPQLLGDDATLPAERPSLSVVLAGNRPAYLSKPEELDAYDAKGVGVALLRRLTGRDVRSRAAGAGCAHLHPRARGELVVDERVAGTFGTLHPDVVDALDTDGAVQVVEIDLSVVESLGRRTPSYDPIPRLPAVTRDIALVVSEDVLAGDVETVIADAAGELCESVTLFDLFRGGSIPDGHRSLAFRVVYRDPKSATDPDAARTLTDKEVDKRHGSVVKAVRQRLGGALRA